MNGIFLQAERHVSNGTVSAGQRSIADQCFGCCVRMLHQRSFLTAPKLRSAQKTSAAEQVMAKVEWLASQELEFSKFLDQGDND